MLICGGFFDIPGARKRLGELESLMAGETFWNNREQAQKIIEEANSLRDKVEPLLTAEKKLEDFQVMVELGEAEPVEAQDKIQQELELCAPPPCQPDHQRLHLPLATQPPRNIFILPCLIPLQPN